MAASNQAANSAVERMACIKFFPTGKAAAQLAALIRSGCRENEDAEELVARMVAFDEWPGPATMLELLRQITGTKECSICGGTKWVTGGDPCPCVKCKTCGDSRLVPGPTRNGYTSAQDCPACVRSEVSA